MAKEYEPPRTTRMNNISQGKGDFPCSSGSGASSCNIAGNSASSGCDTPGNSAGTICSLVGSGF